MSEKFSLKWNDYQFNWTKSLSELWNDKEFADVTLISEDKVKFSAHKILLSSCSNVFKFILGGNTHANPLMYLSGVNSVNLGLILDYIYHGEVNLFQEQLDSFLESAQKLEIKGLLGGSVDPDPQDSTVNEQLFKEETIEPIQATEDKRIVNICENVPVKSRQYKRGAFKGDVSKVDVSSLTHDEIELKKKELYQKNDGVWKCLACDHSGTDGANMRKHVEIHLDGLSYTCPLCQKEFRSKDMLYLHTKNNHK